jgi:hypothetical protein
MVWYVSLEQSQQQTTSTTTECKGPSRNNKGNVAQLRRKREMRDHNLKERSVGAVLCVAVKSEEFVVSAACD